MRAERAGGSGEGRRGLGARRHVSCLLACTTLLGAGCASRQVIALAIAPAPVEVYVDGALAESGDPASLTLAADRGHVVLIRKRGYRSEQIVLESVAGEDGRRLEPARIELVLQPDLPTGRTLRIELDRPADGGEADARDGAEAR